MNNKADDMKVAKYLMILFQKLRFSYCNILVLFKVSGRFTDVPSSFQLPKDKPKRISKKMRKIQDFEKRLEEKEFDRAFFRMFWPDNV